MMFLTEDEFDAFLMGEPGELGLELAHGARITPDVQLNGNLERSHRSDCQDFYQLLSYQGEVDLKAELHEW